MFSKIKDYVKNNRHVLIFSYWAVHIVWFVILQKTTLNRNPLPIACAADDLIPFCEWFILPYLLWYVQIFAVSAYLFFHNPKVFTRLYIYLFSGMFVCMTVCSVVPMYFDRSQLAFYSSENFLDMSQIVLHSRDNILMRCMVLLQKVNPPTTILPSMHVFVTVGLHLAVCRDFRMRRHKTALWASGFCTFVILVSTLFTKQHSLWDVGAALPLCVLMYFAAYKPKCAKLFELLRIGDKREAFDVPAAGSDA